MQSHNTRIHKVMDFIEQHLDEVLLVKALADLACYSEFHFHRLFRVQVGESVHAYRKRLLLERSVRHLRYSELSVTEIAFQAGYENASSFNRAFKQQFGKAPSDVRSSFDNVTNELIDKGRKRMPDNIETINIRVEVIERQPVQAVCGRAHGGYADAAAEAWGKVMPFGYGNRLMTNSVQTIGVSYDDPSVTAAENIRYDACLLFDTLPDIALPNELTIKTLAGGLYAKVLHKGPYENLITTYDAIFCRWLPSQPYELRDEPCFERYLNRDPRRTKPENLRTEVYVPLKALR